MVARLELLEEQVGAASAGDDTERAGDQGQAPR
jgi:hypothetical protein